MEKIDTNDASESTTTAAAAKPLVRRVYVGHNQYGDCITYKAKVYVPVAPITFDKKVTVKLGFTVDGEQLIDSDGRRWTPLCENTGCGPRLPKDMRSAHGEAFAVMTLAQRREFLKGLKASAAPAQQV